MPIDEDSLSAKDQGTLIKNTFKLLKNGETEINLCEQYKRIVLILGDTGNGKSKFTQWIAGDDSKLIAVDTEGLNDFIILKEDEADKSGITSDTIYPQLVIDEETNVAFYDCPGFNDTRDESNEIATTYFIKKVVDHAQSVKLIFAINYLSVKKAGDRNNFKKLVKHASDFLKNIEKFENSIALVVTKVDKLGGKRDIVDRNKVITAVANFLIEVQQDLELKLQNGSSKEKQFHKTAKKFISILLLREGEQYSRIGIFPMPDKPGPLSEISLLQEEKKHTRRLINEKLAFSEKYNDDFGYTVSEKCKNRICYLVDDINTSVLSSLCRVREEIKDYYTVLTSVILNTIQSFGEETSPRGDLQEVGELSSRLTDGYGSFLSLVDVGSVTNLEYLVQKIKAFLSNLKINTSNCDLLDIENKAKHFDVLQNVSDRQFSLSPWSKFFKEICAFMTDTRKKIQENIAVVAPEIRKQMESDCEQIAKVLQNQFDAALKQLDLKEAFDVVCNYHDIMLKMTEKTKNERSISEHLFSVRDVLSGMNINLPEHIALNAEQKEKHSTFLKAFDVVCNYHDAMLKMTEKTKNERSISELWFSVRDVLSGMNINLPEHIALNAVQKEKHFNFLKAISETELNFEPSALIQPFERLVEHLNKSIKWYKFLDGLYATFSDYEIQNNREKYNVVDVEDWGKPNKPQGIVITKNNFEQFVRNTANGKDYDDDVKNVPLTELRLDELNQILNLTLKHRIDIQYAQTSIFIRADYISIKEMLAHLDNGFNLLAALKSGVYKSLQIFALRKVFIDEDMSLPGVELHIISPKWEIIGTRKISLDGADGEPHSELKAEGGVDFGSDGEDGEPGRPGKPGGNFFGIGAEFINGQSLTVTLNGGRGGQGQHGADGREGESGRDVGSLSNNDLPITGKDRRTTVKGFDCEEIERWNSSFFVFFIKTFGYGGAENIYYKVKGLPGKAGGNGGNGGRGGFGGIPGNSFLRDFNKDSKIKICAVKGKDGVDGCGGEGGKGGMNGKNVLATINGIFKKEWKLQMKEPAGAASNGRPGQPVPTCAFSIPPLHFSISTLQVPASQGIPNCIQQLHGAATTVSTSSRDACVDAVNVPGDMAVPFNQPKFDAYVLNSTGLKEPESSNALPEPFEIINEYKQFANQNLNCRFQKKLLLDFFDLFNGINEITN